MKRTLRNECIAFAEWILQNGYERHEDNGVCWWEPAEQDLDFTTADLYTMYFYATEYLNDKPMA